MLAEEPADLACFVSTITSSTGYSNMDFTVSAGTDALTLTYNSSDGNVELSDVSILPSNSLAVTQTTQGVSNTTAEVQSVAGLPLRKLVHLMAKHYFFMMAQIRFLKFQFDTIGPECSSLSYNICNRLQ